MIEKDNPIGKRCRTSLNLSAESGDLIKQAVKILRNVDHKETFNRFIQNAAVEKAKSVVAASAFISQSGQ